jgi:hypothetical protein
VLYAGKISAGLPVYPIASRVDAQCNASVFEPPQKYSAKSYGPPGVEGSLK